MIARELMDADAPTLSPNDSIQQAAELLTTYEHSDIAVLDSEGHIVGALSEQDLIALALPTASADLNRLSYLPRCYGLRDLSSEQLQGIAVRDIMREKGFATIDEDDLVAQAALLIMRAHQPQIFVVRDGRYVGRLCRKFIISELINPSLGVACHP